MAETPFQAHADTTADYLNWLQANADQNGDPNDPNASVPVFTWNGTDYVCSYKWAKQKYQEAGGRLNLDALVLEVLESLPSIPIEGRDMITFQGQEFRVQIVRLAAGKQPQLTCWDPSRGA